MATEKRTAKRNFQIRAAQGEEFVLAGRALSYNEISSNELAPGVREKIMPGCFRASLASTPVVALFNHQEMTTLPLGRTENGTLKIQDSDSGLDFRVQLDKNNSFHRDVYASVKRGDISECSFQFICQDEDFAQDRYQGQPCMVRCVRIAELRDLSVVTNPFYGAGATNVDARNVAADDAARAARVAKITKEVLGARLAAVTEQIEADKRAMQAAEISSMNDWLAVRLAAVLALQGHGWRLIDWDENYCLAVPLFTNDPDDDEASCHMKCGRFNYQLDPSGNVVLSAFARYTYKLDDQGQPIMSQAARSRYRNAVAEIREDNKLRRMMRATAGIFHN